MDNNLDRTLLAIRECFKSMRGADWRRVIAVASIAGVRDLRVAGTYSASKHGVIAFNRSFNKDHMTDPFILNAICPGYVATPIIEQDIDLMQKKAFPSRMQWQLWFRPIAMRV